MKKPRSKRLQLVVDLALAAESQAARNLSAAQNELAGEQQRLEDIEQYYQSYESQFSQNTTRLNATNLANSRAFLNHLDQARQAQNLQIQHSQAKVDVAREQWRKSHLKSDALASFKQKVATNEQLLVEKQEQKVIDDLVNQRRLPI